MDTGFFKLYRKFLEWEWYGDIQAKVLYLHILLKANHSDKKWRGIDIKTGQFVTSYKTLSQETGLSLQQVRSNLRKLSKSEINLKTTNKFSIITVCNYKTYNDQQQSNNNQTTIKQQSNNNQVTTTKNKENKENKKNDIYRAFDHLKITKTEFNKLINDFNVSEEYVNNKIDYLENLKTNKKYKTIYLTVRNWLRSDNIKNVKVEKSPSQLLHEQMNKVW